MLLHYMPDTLGSFIINSFCEIVQASLRKSKLRDPPLPKCFFFGRGARGEGIGPHPLPFSHRKKHSGRREQKIRGDNSERSVPTLQNGRQKNLRDR